MAEYTQKGSTSQHAAASAQTSACIRTPAPSVDGPLAGTDRGALYDLLNRSPHVQALVQLKRVLNGRADSIQREEEQRAENRTGLPGNLKSGVESLSGISMDLVSVHYNSSAPAQLNALAYAQGRDIHIAPGQERHLPHEAWHVVQQAQGRVQPTLQLKDGVHINDEQALEREAETMGAKALAGDRATPAQFSRDRAAGYGATLQMVRGGMEYTEGGTTRLSSYPGAGGAPGGTAPVATRLFGATELEAYQVPDLQLPAWAGIRRNTDHTVLQNNRLTLTNDVDSSEWVIAGHAAGGVSARQLTAQVMRDVGMMFDFRRNLKGFVDANTVAGHKTVLVPDGNDDFNNPGAEGLFVYRPDNASAGKVQITVQYENVETIRRLNELNASKYLTGTKVPEGRDAGRVAGSRTIPEAFADYRQTTSSATAAALYGDLLGMSVNIVAGGTTLTAAQSALVKLMVVNDAMASNMSRHAAIIGQAEEKNIQRFFPKAERQTYVNAVAQGVVPPAALAALRLDIVANQAAMAQAVWNRADPFALSVLDAIRERTAAAVDAAVASAQTDTDAANAAPAVAAVDVTAAIAHIGPAVANAVSRGAVPLNLVQPAAQAIVGATPVVDPHATAIARVVITAATTARDNVTMAMLPLLAAQRDNTAGLATTQADRDAIKDLVLGPNGGLLAAWIGRAALAYTDATGAAGDHVDPVSGTGNVIRSTRGYTPVAGAGQGAIYEFREREIDVSDGNTAALQDALSKLYGAAE